MNASSSSSPSVHRRHQELVLDKQIDDDHKENSIEPVNGVDGPQNELTQQSAVSVVELILY